RRSARRSRTDERDADAGRLQRANNRLLGHGQIVTSGTPNSTSGCQDGPMERSGLTDSGVMEWVGRYERAWRAADLDAIDELFTPDAHYRTSPYEESL